MVTYVTVHGKVGSGNTALGVESGFWLLINPVDVGILVPRRASRMAIGSKNWIVIILIFIDLAVPYDLYAAGRMVECL